MLVLRRNLPQLLGMIVLTVGVAPRAGALDWSDNFNDGNAEDGNPVTWAYNELGITPGNYDATSGDYTLSAPGGTNNDSLIASVDTAFTNTYVRTQAAVLPGPLPEEVDGTIGVLARYDPSTLSGYAAILSNNGHLELLRVDAGTPFTLTEVDDLEIDSATDAMIQLDAIGDLLNVYLWRPEESKPDTPIATFNDGVYTAGRAGILYNENDDNTLGVFRSAAAQDTPFIDTLAGDFNMSGTVDAADYVMWRNGAASAEDYAIWRANFGAGTGGLGSAAGAVPEPASFYSALMAIAIISWTKRFTKPPTCRR
jgi:hypothetical protein